MTSFRCENALFADHLCSQCLFSCPALCCCYSQTQPIAMDNVTSTITFNFPSDKSVQSTNISIILMEDLTHGQLINDFTLECLVNGSASWNACPMGTLANVIPRIPGPGIGHKRILMMTPPSNATLTGVRLALQHALASPVEDAVPTLRSMQLYDWNL